MSLKLEAERIMLREIIRRLFDYNEPKNKSINKEMEILEERVREIDNEIGEYTYDDE